MALTFHGPRDILADLLIVARGGLPADVANPDRADIETTAACEVLMYVEGQTKGWVREARLSTSHGKYTDQHAKDRGTGRADNESDETLKERLRLPPSAVTVGAVEDALAALTDEDIWVFQVPLDIGAVMGDGITEGSMTALDIHDGRMMNIHTGHVIAVVPAEVATAAEQVLRERVSAGKTYHVEEF